MWVSRIVFGILALAMVAAAIGLLVSRGESQNIVEYVALATTEPSKLALGDTIRINAKVEGAEQHISVYKKTPCVAFWTFIESNIEYTDSDGDRETESETLVDRKQGPKVLNFSASQWTLHIPLDRWTEQRGALDHDVKKLPAWIPPQKQRSRGKLLGYSIDEVALRKGTSVFIAGVVKHVDQGTKTITIEEDQHLGERLELMAGSQQELVAIIKKEIQAAGLGSIFLGALALFFVGLLILFEVKNRRGSSAA